MSDIWAQWPKSKFLELPYRDASYNDGDAWWECLLFTPLRRLHDSGYNTFTIIGVDDHGPKERIHNYDVITLWDGLDFSIDCLYPSGVFRIFSPDQEVNWSYGRIKTRPSVKSKS